MERRWTWVAWSMLAIYVACQVIGLPLSVANGNIQRRLGFYVALTLAFTTFMVVGAVIVAHRPGNAIGWLFSAIGLLTATGGLAVDYAQYAYVTRPGSLPGALLAAWYQWWWLPMFALILVVTPLLFPTGRLLSARWRPLAVAAAAATAAIAVLGALQPTLTLQSVDYTVRNPIGLTGVPDPEEGAFGIVVFGVLAICAVAALISLVLRFRRSRGVERQQLKWFTYAAVLAILFQLVAGFVAAFLPEGAVSNVLFGLSFAFTPIAAGIAIMRHRLYDIDRLINRTLVYGLLTAILGLGYAAAVLVLGEVFGGIGAEPPSWAVATATLAVAALFQPVRRRIQVLVDQRFNRRKYDAAKTVEAFSARLREEIDLDALSAELLGVADQTLQPTQVWLWLRPAIRASQDRGM
jgi:MFS family permease